MIFDERKRGIFFMKQYTIGVTVSCKKLMKVMAHNKNEAVTKAEIVIYDTNAMHFDSDDIVKVSVEPEPSRPIQHDKTNEIDSNLDDMTGEINPCDIYCSGCPDYDSEQNLCKKTGVCGEEYDFPPAFGEKNG